MLCRCSSCLQKTTNTPTLNGGGRGGVWILLFSEVTLFEDNVSTILAVIVNKSLQPNDQFPGKWYPILDSNTLISIPYPRLWTLLQNRIPHSSTYLFSAYMAVALQITTKIKHINVTLVHNHWYHSAETCWEALFGSVFLLHDLFQWEQLGCYCKQGKNCYCAHTKQNNWITKKNVKKSLGQRPRTTFDELLVSPS